MYGCIEQVVKEIAKDEVKLKEFLSLTDIDEIYEYINEIDPSIEKEEFDEFLVSALGNYMEQNASLLSDYDLENVAGGMGITTKDFNILDKMKIDVMTMGNHTWGKKDIFSFIDNQKILRPANYSRGVPGKGYATYMCKGKKISVISLIGRTDINVLSENPFTVVEDIINDIF